jgi:hypothetical protein
MFSTEHGPGVKGDGSELGLPRGKGLYRARAATTLAIVRAGDGDPHRQQCAHASGQRTRTVRPQSGHRTTAKTWGGHQT